MLNSISEPVAKLEQIRGGALALWVLIHRGCMYGEKLDNIIVLIFLGGTFAPPNLNVACTDHNFILLLYLMTANYLM
jgi:hypothetical protein